MECCRHWSTVDHCDQRNAVDMTPPNSKTNYSGCTVALHSTLLHRFVVTSPIVIVVYCYTCFTLLEQTPVGSRCCVGMYQAWHPNHGTRYPGVTRTAYLPASYKGNVVFKMLLTAFQQRLTFTIGKSRITGSLGVINWNNVHHKSSIHGGPEMRVSGHLRLVSDATAITYMAAISIMCVSVMQPTWMVFFPCMCV